MQNTAMFNDFYQVPDLKFDIQKLRRDLEMILSKKNFKTLGISHFGAIMLNRVPGDENSTKGHNIRGVYGQNQTKPEKKLKEIFQ